MKWCNKCQQARPLECFAMCRSKRLGVASTCKQCQSEISRAHYLSHKAAYKRKAKAWKLRHPNNKRDRYRWHAANLSDLYVRDVLRVRSIPVTPESIKAERRSILLHRSGGFVGMSATAQLLTTTIQ